ncbi:MAG: alpha/beta fold hydrolase [Bifidobacteriaceae bacterium]|nr:alpha/beta fold hydrolase [Bifidobacteriaceae bacterium]
MTELATYYVPGLYVEDHSTTVPLDWSAPDGSERLSLFYRVLCAPGNENRDLPLLVFLQGGPGGPGPRPLSPQSDGWIAEAVRHFRVVLPDQRGTGRSSRVQSSVARRFDTPRGLADYLHHFLADSIIRDFEHLRRTEFGGRRWVTLGQSYGGFLTLTYLSLFPEAIAASFTTGGIPAVPASPAVTYAHTVPKMLMKTARYYERYPQDAARVAAVADRLADGDVRLPNGDVFTVRRLQTLGQDFGMKPSGERLHWLLDQAFCDGDGSVPSAGDAASAAAPHGSDLSEGFLMNVLAATESYNRPLYWTLQEFIYQDGGDDGECEPANWAASREIATIPGMSPDARPLQFIGEAALPESFADDSSLAPFRAAEDLLMADTHWGKIYDAARLASNEVPLQAALYFDDMYVPSELSLDTLSRVGNSHAWVTNEFEHDGVHGPLVFRHLYNEALNRGDLKAVPE